MEVSSEEYVVFGVVLFLWELVPTTFVVLFFRAQRLSQNLVGQDELLRLNTSCFGSRTLGRLSEISLLAFFFLSQTPAGMVNSHSYSSRAYFFDNPRRYDSDDDLSRLGAREGG